MEKKHNIIDNQTNKTVGYTVEGILGSLLIYLDDGEYFHDQFHSETCFFDYWCKWFNFDYRLELIISPIEDTSVSDSKIFADALQEVFDNISSAQTYPTETEMVNAMRMALAKRNLESNFTCSDATLLIGYGPNFNSIVISFKIHYREDLSCEWLGEVAVDAELVDIKYDFINKEFEALWEWRP